VIEQQHHPLVEASQLGRRTTVGQWLIRDVSMQVLAGDRLAIVGRSGSGKTLFLRALALLDPVDEGEVHWHGQAVRNDRIPEYRSRVVYLHQRAPLVEGTVEDNLRRPFRFGVHKGRAFDVDRITKWLELLGRDRTFLAKPTGELSGGETQITALLRAMQLDPELLLLDEPTAALDRDSTQVVEQLIDHWHSETAARRALVLVTHDAQQAERIANSVLQMQDGTLV
jgi:putative ABC transport system ATP-binding protein